MKQPLVEVNEIKKYFPVDDTFLNKASKNVKAIDGVTLNIYKGETLGLVGESGCGKSTLGRVISQLISPTNGNIVYDNINLSESKSKKVREIRKNIQVVFQDPYNSLNPRHTVEKIISEPFRIHKMYSVKERRERIQYLLERVGLNSNHMKRYPHEFSGGQRQRISIARTLALNPDFIIADEPVSALDVSVQSQIVNIFQDLQEELNITYLFISHDLSIVKHISDRVAVMYLGKIVELADKKVLYEKPLHPYTEALLSALPVPNPNIKKERIVLKGGKPSPVNPPTGCHFHPRCPYRMDICKKVVPELKEKNGRLVACHLYE